MLSHYTMLGLAEAWNMVIICECVCVCVHTTRGKELYLSVPNLLQM